MEFRIWNLEFGNRRRGQLLIEAMIAISVITVGIAGVLALLSQSLTLNRVVADQYTATYLAAEGIEVVKNIIDTNIVNTRPWNQGLTDGAYEVDFKSIVLTPDAGRQIQFDAATGRFGYQGGTPTNYRRQVLITLISADEVRVNSIVNWITHGSGAFSLDTEDHFFNWRP
ncbi:MAG: prepilin-type N-terminal cleavage/methylation domain-containing protein [bacterium]|nr:prepilin-type N-terminal cleavage/methylation domain-containing protein [bacterium]